MGKTIRWLKGLFGFRKGKHQSNSDDRKHNIQSCIGRSRRDTTNSPADSPLLKTFHTNSDEQNRRAIAVAVATAAAADAAVAAAQAAISVVRLTSQNRVSGAGDRENYAAIKIQALFRGHLSRKALKALKSLVKLQAVVRGYLVRKEAVETLQGMEALFRARSTVYAHSFRLQQHKSNSTTSIRGNEARSRRISSPFPIPNEGRPNLIEVGQEKPKSRLTRANTWAWDTESRAQTPSPLYYEFEPRFSTTHNTPHFEHSCGPYDYMSISDEVSKDDSFASHPGYMANTKSFRAKVRSCSAPKQRPDLGLGLGLKKKVGPNEVKCGPKMEKSKSQSPSLDSLLGISFKNRVMSKIGKSSKV